MVYSPDGFLTGKGFGMPEGRGYVTADEMRENRHAGEVERLFGLSDRFLARAIINLSRRASAGLPFDRNGVLPRPLWPAAHLVREIAPEIARRLGEREFNPGEVSLRLVTLDEMGLRDLAWQCLERVSFSLMPVVAEGAGESWRLLLNDPWEGNILFIALDRMGVPGPDSGDRCARYLVARARSAGHGDLSPAWHPRGGEAGWPSRQAGTQHAPPVPH